MRYCAMTTLTNKLRARLAFDEQWHHDQLTAYMETSKGRIKFLQDRDPQYISGAKAQSQQNAEVIEAMIECVRALNAVKRHADAIINKRNKEKDPKEKAILQNYAEATCSGAVLAERALAKLEALVEGKK